MSSSKELRVVVITCMVLQDMLERLLPEDLAEEVQLMDYGLHRVPSRMVGTLQDAINNIQEPSLVVLGYGLCGNGLKGIKAGKHTLLAPRTDDCIALLLGSYQTYLDEFHGEPGTYYLTKGWLESGSNPKQEYEEYIPKYGAEQALWIMDQQYQHYKRLMLVARDQEDLEKYRPQAQEVARFCERWGMRYEERLGSDHYVRRLIEVARALNNGHDTPEWLKNDFVIIPPGGEIRQEMFIRDRRALYPGSGGGG